MAPEEGKVKDDETPSQVSVEGREEQPKSSCSAPDGASACLGSDVVETEELVRFSMSLQELREITSQLHHAADYCESTFLNSDDKKSIVDNTKEYVCRALVTMVDHLGNVTANITSRLSEASSFADSELRIDSLKQRILSCKQLGHEYALRKVGWSAVYPRHHPRYLLTDSEKQKAVARDSVRSTSKINDHDQYEFDMDDGLPLFLCTQTMKSLQADSRIPAGDSKIVPVHDGSPTQSKGSNPTFHFQANHKICNGRNRRSFHGSNIISFIRRVTQSS